MSVGARAQTTAVCARRVWVAVAVAVMLVGGRARAQPAERSVLDAVSTPESASCLARADVANAVSFWLSRSTVDHALSIVVEVEGADERDATFVVLRSQSVVARRRFPTLPAECADRRSVIGLAIAIAIDATLLESLGVTDAGPASSPRPDVSPEPVASADPDHVAHPVARRASRHSRTASASPWGIAASAEAGAAWGVLPAVTFVAGPSVELRLGSRLAFRASASATPSIDVPLGRGVAELQALSGRLDACAGVALGDAETAVCLGAMATRIDARGRGYTMPRATHVWASFALARIALRWPRSSPISGRVALDALAGLERPTIDVRDPGGSVLDASRVPAAGAMISGALVVTLR